MFLSRMLTLSIFWWCLFVVGCTQAPAPSASSSGNSPLNGYDSVAFINRITWGVNASIFAQVDKLGMATYLALQLHPKNATLPKPVQAKIDSLTISHSSMEDLVFNMEQMRKEEKGNKDAQKKEARRDYQQELTRLGNEAATRSLLRNLYSPNQLQEQMTWFWMNHFNVNQHKNMIRAMIGDYEDSIRSHALGKFRDLLRATSHHPAMLVYLDNEKNAVGHINENYARELMELHSLGVDSGYTQKDVQELARILTGVGVAHAKGLHKSGSRHGSEIVRKGLFEFNPKRHDYGDKLFLGQTIKGEGLSELDQAIDILCKSPATAHFVSRKLAIFFVSDEPSSELIDKMAATFLASDGDIAATLQLLFSSPEFLHSLNHHFKDPIHYVNSAVRLAYDTQVIENPTPIINWLNRMGEPLYGKPTPDGYPLVDAAWTSSGQMATRFDIAKIIGAGNADLFKSDGDLSPKTPAPPELNNHFYIQVWRRGLSDSTRDLLDRTTSAAEWNLYLLSSPEFMQR